MGDETRWVTKWVSKQLEMSREVVEADDRGAHAFTLVGGLDISYDPEGISDACVAGLVVLELPSKKVVYETFLECESSLPYIPGFLGFREAPLMLQLLERMVEEYGRKPDVVLVDGNGVLHNMACGSACHVGVLADVVSIGVAKTYFGGAIRTLPSQKELQLRTDAALLKAGDRVDLVDGATGKTVGAALRTSDGAARPVFVSVGHRICLDTAVAVVMACSGTFRIPEPIRQADLKTRDLYRRATRLVA